MCIHLERLIYNEIFVILLLFFFFTFIDDKIIKCILYSIDTIIKLSQSTNLLNLRMI